VAGEADVLSATAKCNEKSLCRFTATVRHADEGWKHFADRWEVVGPDGKILATRVLRHPHVKTQPFTRGMAGVAIPREVRRVTIRAHDSVHGYGGREVTIELAR